MIGTGLKKREIIKSAQIFLLTQYHILTIYTNSRSLIFLTVYSQINIGSIISIQSNSSFDIFLKNNKIVKRNNKLVMIKKQDQSFSFLFFLYFSMATLASWGLMGVWVLYSIEKSPSPEVKLLNSMA